MGIDNNSTVAISITVRDDGSIALIDAAESKLIKLQNVSVGAGSAVGKLASNFGLAGANLGAFGNSISSTTQQMTGLVGATMTTAAAAENAGARTVDSFNKVGGSIQGVRLAVQEMGLRVPRAMESIIAHNAALAGALQITMGLFVGLGAIEIGAQMIQGLGALYEKWLDVDKAVDDYRTKAADAAREKLIDTGSLETTLALLGQVNGQVDQLQQRKVSLGVDDLGGKVGQYVKVAEHYLPVGMAGLGNAMNPQAASPFTPADDQNLAKGLETQQKLKDHQSALEAQMQEQRMRDQKQYDEAATQSYGKISAAQRDSDAITSAHYDRLRSQAQELAGIINASPEAQKQGLHITPDILKNQYNQQEESEYNSHFAEASGQRVAMSRQESDEITKLQVSAAEAGLKGEALANQKRLAEINAFVEKYGQSQTARSAIDERYERERLAREQDLQDKLRKMQDEASTAGLTGIPKIQAGQQSKTDALYTEGGGDLGFMFKGAQVVQQQTDQEMLQSHQEFTQKIDQLVEESSGKTLAGSARIAEQERQSLTKLGEEFTAEYGKDQNAWQGYQDRKLQIEQNADRERAQYARQVDEQITQTEAEAARAYLPPWQAAQAQILDQYQQRVAKAKAALDQQAIDQQQYDREIVADSALAQAQISRQMEQTRDQVAGQLEQMFTNPAKYMEQRAKQMMMDIVANWVTQLMQANPHMQGLVGGLLGMNKMGTQSNPMDAMKSMFGAHADAGGSTLMSAGSTLSSSGTMLAGSASRLSASATALMQAASSFSSSSGTSAGGGAGQINQLSDMMTGAGTSGGTSIGGFGGAAGLASGPGGIDFGGGPLSGAYSVANTVAGAAGVGGPVSAVTGMATTAGTLAQQAGLLGGSTQMLNPDGAGGFGGLQATDLPPTNSAGVLGTVPDSPTGTGGTAAVAGGAGAAGVGIGAGLTAISTGMALSQEWAAGKTGSAILTGAMGGAGIGGMIGGLVGGPLGSLIGMGIGAAGGALIGFIGSLFSDHGLSKAKHYNTDVVLPSIQKEMNSFNGGGGGYDQASQDLNNLMVQAQQQCKSFGSGALSYYNSTIVPEINAAQAQVDRESKGGRANVTMSTAQFDSGGVVSSFGDMATGPFSGLVHLRMGERVMNPMASMMHAPLLDAMNSGTAALSAMRRSAPLGNSGGGGEIHNHYHFNAMDAKSFHHWARMGGAQMIQSVVNGNTSRYAGKALE